MVMSTKVHCKKNDWKKYRWNKKPVHITLPTNLGENQN